MDNLKILTTGDGSPTLLHGELDEIYHSRHGAWSESCHVFIKEGLQHYLHLNSPLNELRILEVGLGTGLNAALSFRIAQEQEPLIVYTGVESHPIAKEVVEEYFAHDFFDEHATLKNDLKLIHRCSWEERHSLHENFQFEKVKAKIEDFKSDIGFDVIYFDAFAPEIQGELWTDQLFVQMYTCLNPKGVLVTYCAKGVVKRSLKKAGFVLEAPAGPIGKREMIRATKVK